MTDAPARHAPDGFPPEPDRAPLPLAARLLVRALAVALLTAALLPLWPLFALGLLLDGYPPNVPRPGRVLRYVLWTLTRRPDEPPIPLLVRGWVLLTIARKAAAIPLWGLAWMLDERLYGRRLDATAVEGPLFHISAGRSGSTRMARCLEDDPRLVAPNLLQIAFPYLWLWRLAPRLGKRIDPDKLREAAASRVEPAFTERHAADLFGTETFDALLFGMHLCGWSIFLGPRVMAAEFAMGRAGPTTERLWTETAPRLIARLAQKTLLHAGPAPDGRSRRFVLKGHFLAAAEALTARFPDARFLTIVRAPAPRLRSLINFIRVNPAEPVLGGPPWQTIAPALAQTEVDYCRRELSWYDAAEGPIRCAVRFEDFVGDLEGTLRVVYRTCLDGEPPPEVARAHPPRALRPYTVDRTLAEVGIDAEAWQAPLTDYRRWRDGLSLGSQGSARSP